MDEDELVLPAIYNFTPLRALRVASRRKLSSFLDLEGVLVVVNNDGIASEVLNNYTGLAELAGFNYQDIMNMERQRSPTTELLDLWTGQNGNVGKLWTYLYMMGRYDVLTDCRRLIVQDCVKYEEQQKLKPVQDCLKDEEQQQLEKGTTSEIRIDQILYNRHCCWPLAPVRESKTFYDAFICYTAGDENDRQFLYKMIDELEVKRGLKLFVPGRDDLPGSAEYTITAYLVEKRCTRVVILTSRMFLQSAACDFQVKFAHALSPGARSKKLIPVIHEKNTQLPRILRFLPVCDFTKSEMVEWVWNRLFTAIIAPVGPTTYFEEGDPSNPFEMSDESLKDIIFPSHPRLDELEDSSNHMDENVG